MTHQPAGRRALSPMAYGDPVVVACFLASGVAALVDEVCWIRIASTVFGSTTLALSTVLAVFFAGLALGNVLFGRLAQRTTRPLRAYGVVEIAVAVAGAATLIAFPAADAAYGWAYRTLGGQTAALSLARFVLVTLVLLAPTVLMGGTLPLLCRHFVRREGRIARSVGLLYAVNTLGAAAGCAAAGFLLIPTIGVRASILLAAAIDLGAGAAALALRAPAIAEAAAPDRRVRRRAPQPAATPPRRVLMGALFFGTGFAALGGEVIWTRFLALLVPNTVLTYTLTLTVVLVGIVLGSVLAAAVFDRSARRVLWFGALQVATGLTTLALMKLPPELWRGLGGELPICAMLLLPGAILSGASFPLAIRIVLDEPRLAGIGVGVMSAANTMGGIAGALVIGFAVLPRLGLEASLLVTTGVSTAIGVTAWLAVDRPLPAPRARLAAAAFAAAVWLAVPVPAIPAWLGLPGLGTRVPADFLAEPGKLVAYREGRMSNLAVVRSGDVLQLEIDRWWQGEDRKNHQIMAAHIPLLLHPRPRSALVVGVGTGQTPARFLLYDDVERLDCVDIEPAIFDFVRPHFDSAWMEDERVRLIAEDGRNHLAHTAETYDVISLEVGQLFRPGIAAFYTSDFYRRAAERLNPGGILAQFVPLPFLSVEELRRVIRSFLDAFPHSILWYNTSEVLLLGARDGTPSVDLDALTRRLHAPAVAEDLHYSYWGGPAQWLARPEVFLAGYLCGPSELAALAADAEPYRDDRPVLEYATARVRTTERRELASAELLRANLAPIESILAGVPPDGAGALDEARALRDQNVNDMAANANLRIVERQPDMPTEQAVTLLAEALAWNPGSFACHRRLADVLCKAGRFDEAHRSITAAIAIRADDGESHRILAFLLLQAGRFDEAIVHLRAALATRPDDPDVHNYLGAALAQTGDLAGAVQQFEEAVRLNPTDAGIRANLDRARRGLEGR